MATLESDMPNQIPEDQEQRRALGVAIAAKKVLRYFHADEITGVRVSAKTQQRLVHRHTFLLPNPDEAIEEICVDGGKVRLRTAQGEACEWRDYKAIATAQGRIANFQNNAQLIELESFAKRLKALEAKSAQDNLILTEAQVQALEQAKVQEQAMGEIETEHPGYLGSQDTFYVGTLKGVGRIYQQTFIDTYTRFAHLKLYDRKNALVAADLLNDRVIP